MSSTTSIDVFLACVDAIQTGKLIRRQSKKDKEFHFQDWFEARLKDVRLKYDPPARNTYPDFRLVTPSEGYEVKALAYPGRWADYDANSQVPSGYHNGRSIYYVFGRYPKDPDSDEYPVVDLVMCHGDFLNADHDYSHLNKSVRGFGSYGDIMIRDRKMYVVPTPFALADGTNGQKTLILPADIGADPRLEIVGHLVRVESEKRLAGYAFDLVTNQIKPTHVPNPDARREHRFIAYRAKGTGGHRVEMRKGNVEAESFEDALEE